jgi:hypothetical protein
MITRGRRVRVQSHLTTLDYSTGKNRPLTRSELAHILAERIASLPGSLVTAARLRDLERWIGESVIVPGERRGRGNDLPAAGLRVPHYLGLIAFNRSVTRERFWAAFFYSAFKSDFEASNWLDGSALAGVQLERFLKVGLESTPDNGSWSVDFSQIAHADAELLLVSRALAAPASQEFPSASAGLPVQFFSTATQSAKGLYDEFLCPGSIIQLRRAVRLLLGSDARLGHSAISELLESVLVNHAAIYFVRGLKVLNDLNAGRELSSSCAACWDRFQPDVRVETTPERTSRLQQGAYAAAGSIDDADWVERNCDAKPEVFVNAGRKELTSAKELARLSLEDLRRQLAAYTVNRICTAIAIEVASSLAQSLGEQAPSLPDVYATLDRWASDPGIKVALAVLWTQKIATISEDKDVPGPVLESLDSRVSQAAGNPRILEDVVREMVAETILSARAFTRYVELMNSLLGGGALPSNQDPKGLLARGGNRSIPFHLSLNDKSLEAFVAAISLDASERGEPLSFPRFIATLKQRYGILIEAAPAGVQATAGLVAEASAQSREALRSRLHSMGFLDEFSDSSEWNRVTWRRGRSQ